MLNVSESFLTVAIVAVALWILGWGFYRAKPFGKLGILAWLQSVVLMAPWLLFFGLFAAGIYLNLVGVLFLLVASAGLYIVLGRKLRAAGQEAIKEQLAKTLEAKAQAETDPDQPAEVSTSASPPPVQATVVEGMMPIPSEDLQMIQGIFGIDTFFATETIPFQNGAIFKGNLRGEADVVYDRLASQLTAKLGDRYRLFFVEGTEGRPVMIVLPSANDPQPLTTAQKILAAVLLLATIATSLETSGLLMGFDFYSHLERWRDVVPFCIGLALILVAHELGHWWQAKRHHVRLSFPFFLPTWQIGSFGALTRFASVLPNRSVLFDIALAGPALGGLVSLSLLVIGLVLSHPGSLFQVPSQFFQGSILVGALARVVLGENLGQSLVDVHPLVLLGWLGLVITAINLMPAGQLDGGRIVQAIYGRKTAGRTTVATLIVLGIASLANSLALYWAVLILFLQRDLERPSLNEISEPDDARAALGLLALFLMVTVLMPLTPSLAGRLGIGG